MNKYIIYSIFLFTTLFVKAQVGVGTTNPTAQLTIDATATTKAALELIPQTTPSTTLNMGQLAVIGDQLFMYDSVRAKWLSLETSAIQFSRGGNNDNRYLYAGGTGSNANSGVVMPFNGTIIAITANISGGNATKSFEVRVRNGTTAVSNVPFSLVAGVFSSITENHDFVAGDYLKVRVLAPGASVANPTVTVWVKWRK